MTSDETRSVQILISLDLYLCSYKLHSYFVSKFEIQYFKIVCIYLHHVHGHLVTENSCT